MKLKFRTWTFPIAVLIVLILTFGVMIPVLGLYWDDWPALVAARLRGVWNFWEFYKGERPFSAWTYILTMPVFGTHPLTWHIITLLLRWLAVLSMWWTLRGLWPTRTREVSWMALIFAVYPVFTNQSVALAFSQHWITFILYFLSIGLMIQAIRRPRYYWLLTGLALFTEIVHILTMEYFWGLELIRPFLLWILFSEQQLSIKQKIKKTLLHWSPYLLMLLFGLFLRMTVFVNLSKDPNRPDLLYSLKDQPIFTILRLIQLAVQDLIYNLFGGWLGTIQSNEINIFDWFYIFSLLIAVVVGGLTFYYLSRLEDNQPETSGAGRKTWIRQALLVGFLCTMFGPIPVWLSDRQVLLGMYGGRFGLAAEFGLSILIFALLEWLTVKPLPKIILVSVVIGLASGYHVRIARVYQFSSDKQNQFYWQLYWRAPYIKPDTAIMSSDELFSYVGRNSTSVALNLLYPQPKGSPNMAYWFYETDYEFSPKNISSLADGRPLKKLFRNFSFEGNSRDSVLIDYSTSLSQCLWLLSAEDLDNVDLPELTRATIPTSNLGRIEGEPISSGYPLKDVFGKEPEHTWCFYFQKADLARQLTDWRMVAQLGDEAQQLGFQPSDANEWIPFIQGYAYTNEWEKAIDRVDRAFEMKPEIAPRLCRVLQQAVLDIRPPKNISSAIDQKQMKLGCSSN